MFITFINHITKNKISRFLISFQFVCAQYEYDNKNAKFALVF